ncbi:MAG TPA: SDR family oxidoreductase [Deltaproteobacteria bacterium]|nr:SDR family oxidoreductase [Deltaproteobacteria bacterium]
MQRFEGKLVYITGGSSGIGLEMGKIFAARGADLLLMARGVEKLQDARKAVQACRLHGSQRIETLSVDVADPRDVQTKMSGALEDLGAPDILISSAGINKYADRFENISYEMFDEVMKINLYGPRTMIQTLLPAMEQKKGHIVVLSSAAAFFGMFGYTAYGTSKAALLGLCDSLRYELKPKGMTLTVVCPGEVDTPMNIDEARTLPREGRAGKNFSSLMTPEDAAREIVAAIERKQYLFIPGGSTRLLYLLHRLTGGWLTRSTSDAVIRLARRRMRN